MVPPENPPAGKNSGRHRAPDGDAQTAYIPRITDASPDGVPGGPLAPPVGLGANTQPPGDPQPAATNTAAPGIPQPAATNTAAPGIPQPAATNTAAPGVPQRFPT